jgi:hypothetical protein
MWEAGHKWALPLALTLCFLKEGQPPEWVRLAWLKAYRTLRDFKAKNWEDVLGSPQGKGAHRKNRKLHAELRYRIVCRALESTKVVPETFEEIAEEIRADGIAVSAATVKAIYYRPEARALRALIKAAREHGLNSDFLA